MVGFVRIHRVGQVAFLESAVGAVADLANLLVGTGVVVAGADEAIAIVIVDGDLVSFADEPSQEVAGFADLVAKSVGTPRGAVEPTGSASASANTSSRLGGRLAAGVRVIGEPTLPVSAHRPAWVARPWIPGRH